MSHKINEKIIQFFDALQRQTGIGIQNVSLVQDLPYIVEYRVVWANQMFNIWHNKLAVNDEDKYGWGQSNPFQGFTTHFSQGFDTDSV